MPEPHGNGGVSDARLIELADTAAKKAVSETFRQLRIRVDEESSIDAFIDNQRFLTELRLGRAQTKAEIRSGGVGLAKWVVQWVAIAALLGLFTALGIHSQSGVMPQLPLPPGLGGHP